MGCGLGVFLLVKLLSKLQIHTYTHTYTYTYTTHLLDGKRSGCPTFPLLFWFDFISPLFFSSRFLFILDCSFPPVLFISAWKLHSCFIIFTFSFFSPLFSFVQRSILLSLSLPSLSSLPILLPRKQPPVHSSFNLLRPFLLRSPSDNHIYIPNKLTFF